jgi:hypothetical protein
MSTVKGTAVFDPDTGAFAFTPDAESQPNPEPEPEPPGEFWDVSKLDKSLAEYPRPTNSKPGYLKPIVDPRFRTKITRIVGDPGTQIGDLPGTAWGTIARHHYSKDQAWNCDQSLIYLDQNSGGVGGNGVFLHGDTYKPAFMRNGIPTNSDVRWHHADPDLMFYAADDTFGTWNVRSGDCTVIRKFDGYEELKLGPWEGNLSSGGVMVALSIGEEGGFAYRISDDKSWRDIEAGSLSDRALGSVSISPKGTSLVWNFEDDSVVVTNLDGKILQTTAPNQISHFDLTIDSNGDEVMVGRDNRDNGHILKIRLSDLAVTELTKGGFGQHTGARGVVPYCVSDFVDNRPNHQPYEGEICLIALDGSAVYRLCHHHGSKTPDYNAEFHASMSPDGGRVIFASTWDASGSEPRPVQSYVVDFRDM